MKRSGGRLLLAKLSLRHQLLETEVRLFGHESVEPVGTLEQREQRAVGALQYVNATHASEAVAASGIGASADPVGGGG